MISGIEHRGGNTRRMSRIGAQGAIVALAALISLLGGCNRDEVIRAFRAGASDQLQAGAESIALGVINGAFSAFDIGADDSAAGETSTSTETP